MSSGSKWPKNQKHQDKHSRVAPAAERDVIGELAMRITAEARARTEAIVRMETDLNTRVYTLFDLTPTEIKISEESAKYAYGEV
jgi:hypothetical protein